MSLRVRGTGELNALLVHRALNVFFSLCFKTSVTQQNNGAKQQNYFSFLLFSLGAAVTVDEK